MSTIPETLTSSFAPDACHQVLDALFLSWPDAPSDCLSSAHLDHLRQCRSCLRKWIAFEAAADLAFPAAPLCEPDVANDRVPTDANSAFRA
jgi:hypothetical protein